MSLLESASCRPGGYLALSDQDDVWMPHRLGRAVDMLAEIAPGQAGIYASRTMLTDAALRPRGISWGPPRCPEFANALVQNVLAGNTIVLNHDAACLATRTAPAALAGAGVPHHDWWLYQLMTGAGATVIHDDRPGLYYRQHQGNLLGANRGLRRGLSRFAALIDHHFADWIDRNLAALDRVAPELTEDNRALLKRFRDWRAGQGRTGPGVGLPAVGVWRQSRLGNHILEMSARTGRI